MCAMLLAILLICAAGSSQGVDVATCSNGTESLTFTPYNDGVTGRYLVELCTGLVPEATAWEVWLTFYDSGSKCKNSPLKFHIPGKIHSHYRQTIQVDGNCSHICLNTTFDLIFSRTYSIDTQFIVDDNLRHLNHTCVTVNNNYTIDDFKSNQALVDSLSIDDEHMILVLHTGVPFLSYDGFVCKILDTITDVEEAECPRLSECTAPSSLELRCPLALPDACYKLTLTLHATWTVGVMQKQGMITHRFCKTSLPDPAVEGSNPAWVWAAAALAVAGAACVAARVAWSALRRRTLHKAVLREWLVHRNEPTSAPSPAAAAAAAARRHVLLLYAREGPRAAPVAAALRALLELCPGTQVYDIFSAEVTALAAAAPAEWLRGLLRRADVAVVLLQTPALAALYRAPAGDAGRLAEPLLGRRVRYRAPAYGDTLLQYALRLAADAPRALGDYRKYYLATLSELPTEMFPQLVPYRRYALPGAAPLLLEQACGAAPAAAAGAALAALERAAAAFAEHARECPDYLMEELVLL